MNTLIISGGSGNDALVKGIVEVYPECNITVLVNAYDNGKSTGVCRKVTNTLGVSDIRKNHSRMYKATHAVCNKNLLEFYEGRYNLTPGNELNEVVRKLICWNLDYLCPYAESFFSRNSAKQEKFEDFSISNIIYAEMYSQHGYEQTNKFFCDLLDIKDFVILNSFDNVYIEAVTSNGNTIDDEGKIVEFANKDDKITNIIYSNIPEVPTLNPVAIEAVLAADLIVISSGTFWASIYPTLQYQDFYKALNNSSAKKIWVMNNNEDKDAYGVSSNHMIQYVQNLGVDLSEFVILQNNDAVETLREDCNNVSIRRFDMGNFNGKHDAKKLAESIFKIYFEIEDVSKYNMCIFDFDDTLWARPASDSITDMNNLLKSKSNIELVNGLSMDTAIISGNSYESIARKLSLIYGSELEGFNVPIWADANSTNFVGRTIIGSISELFMDRTVLDVARYLKDNFNLDYTINSDTDISYIKIKPLSPLEQQLLTDYLNHYMFPTFGLTDCVAKATGKTTVDILSRKNNKTAVINSLGSDASKILYVGDEFDGGNDTDIATMVAHSIHVKDIYETNLILRLLQEN